MRRPRRSMVPIKEGQSIQLGAVTNTIDFKGIGNVSRERIVITELNLTMLVTGLLIISSLPEGKKWNFLGPNNNPADFESELVGKIAKLIQQSIAKKGLQ